MIKVDFTNKIGERVLIKSKVNPLYGDSKGSSVALVEPTVTVIEFEGLKGKSKDYMESADIYDKYTLFQTAMEIVENNCSFESALIRVLKKEFKKW